MSNVMSTRNRGAAALLSAGAIALILTLAACADLLSSRQTSEATLSFAVPSASANANGTAQIVVAGTGPTVDLQSADVTFSEVTFEGANVEPGDDDDSDNDSDSEHPGNSRFRGGATTVSLPLQGGVITPLTGQLPAGTYNRVEMDAEFVRLRGTVNGEAFDVTVPVNAELEQRLAPPLVVGTTSDPVNVSVNVDVASWLRDANGNVVDPRQLNTNPTLRAAFRQRVRASFRAFEDSDRDADESDSDSDSDGTS